MLRFGRYISIPDIEAQLAPNNYMYTHSMTYTFDNYTNTGINATLAREQELDDPGRRRGRHRNDAVACRRHDRQSDPESAVSRNDHAERSGRAARSVTLGVRWTSDNGNDDINLVANGINGGTWGYNNLQWYGWHLLSQVQRSVAHLVRRPTTSIRTTCRTAINPALRPRSLAGGTPFSPRIMPFNAPFLAQCNNAAGSRARRAVQTFLTYVNYKPDAAE